jgi:predicted short-subunit dehydrogenase-like oxidoreductase (DUF2520 family)
MPAHSRHASTRLITEGASIAFHEAGHAVVAYILGRSIVVVTIRRSPSERPRVCITDVKPYQRRRRERAVISALAGGFAEARYRGGVENPVLSPLVIRDDVAYADKELRELGEMTGAIVDKEFIIRRRREFATIAKEIVYEYWRGVKILAAELQEHGLLRGPAVRRVLRPVIGDPPSVKPH